MKKVIVSLLLMFCFISVAQANEPAEVYVFRKASGENWQNFRSVIQNSITTESNGKEKFPTKILHSFAFKFAVQNGYLDLVSEQYQTEEGYGKAFNSYNKLGEYIFVDDFLRIGQGEGFRLPIERGAKSVKSTSSTNGDKISLKESPSEKKPQLVEDSISAQLLAAQNEIGVLNKKLLKLSNNSDVNTLKTEIKEIKTQFSNVSDNLSKLSNGQKSMSDKQSKIAKAMWAELEAVQLNLLKIKTLESETDSKFIQLKTKDAELWEGLNIINNFYYMVALSIVALILVIFLYLVWERRRVSKIATTVKIVAKEVEVIKAKITNLEFDHSAVSVSSLKSMKLGEEKSLIVRNISSGVNYVVSITRDSEFIFLISGINRRLHDSGEQKIDIRNTNLVNMIINAGEPLRFCKVSPEEVKIKVA